jgi:hypothetical protein
MKPGIKTTIPTFSAHLRCDCGRPAILSVKTQDGARVPCCEHCVRRLYQELQTTEIKRKPQCLKP